MQTLALADVVVGNFPMAPDEDLYIVRCDDEVIYVGKTTKHITDRIRQHMASISEFGAALCEWPRLGASITVTIISPADVASTYVGSLPRSLSVDDAEQVLIVAHRPRFNYMYNRGS